MALALVQRGGSVTIVVCKTPPGGTSVIIVVCPAPAHRPSPPRSPPLPLPPRRPLPPLYILSSLLPVPSTKARIQEKGMVTRKALSLLEHKAP
ncbi:hypothetical protein FKM82_009047 [Ascaphus truei]